MTTIQKRYDVGEEKGPTEILSIAGRRATKGEIR
jgi:hypothetical protein